MWHHKRIYLLTNCVFLNKMLFLENIVTGKFSIKWELKTGLCSTLTWHWKFNSFYIYCVLSFTTTGYSMCTRWHKCKGGWVGWGINVREEVLRRNGTSWSSGWVAVWRPGFAMLLPSSRKSSGSNFFLFLLTVCYVGRRPLLLLLLFIIIRVIIFPDISFNKEIPQVHPYCCHQFQFHQMRAARSQHWSDQSIFWRMDM